MYLYIGLAIFAVLGVAYAISEEIAWTRRLGDMAQEVKERGNGEA